MKPIDEIPNHSISAFPLETIGFDAGMSLVDYYAGKALTGLLAKPKADFPQDSKLGVIAQAYSSLAYDMGEALLLERNRRLKAWQADVLASQAPPAVEPAPTAQELAALEEAVLAMKELSDQRDSAKTVARRLYLMLKRVLPTLREDYCFLQGTQSSPARVNAAASLFEATTKILDEMAPLFEVPGPGDSPPPPNKAPGSQ